jgi:hypothetical protein
MRTQVFVAAIVAAAAGTLLTPAANATSLAPGVYRLANHPDGNTVPPPYGARFDELYNATSGHDVFTMDFEHPSSLVTMTYTGSTISITGSAWGGRDIGGTYANDIYLGLYTLNFTYSLGLAPVPGDDDVWVDTTNHVNTGTITSPFADVRNLVDERGSFGYSFRLGDENDDQGHRGFNGISGWGWMSYKTDSGIEHVAATDWIFTVIIPSPASAAMLGLGGMMALRRRR